MAVAWDDRYSTGEERIDGQHKKLFEHIARLESQLGKPQPDAQVVRATLQFLETFARTHFVYEELCMFRHQCPMHEKNQAAHNAFMTVVERVKQRHAAEGATRELVAEVYQTLTDWLVGHICKIDTRLKACLPHD